MIRIIPRLDIKGPNLVKGIHLEGLRVLGKPENFAKLYYNEGADEIIFQDTVASLYERNSLHEIIKKTTDNVFIPITVGGGLRSLKDINSALRSGADKVAINTAAVKNPEFIYEASREFGSSTIVVALEVIKQTDGSYLIFTDNGREYTGINVLSWIKEIEQLGAGEISITSIDREGTGNGMDIDLINKVTNLCNLPIIAHGGIGKIDHIIEVIKQTNINALAISSLFHYNSIKKIHNFDDNFDAEGNVDYLKASKEQNLSGFEETDLSEVKNSLQKFGIQVRVK